MRPKYVRQPDRAVWHRLKERETDCYTSMCRQLFARLADGWVWTKADIAVTSNKAPPRGRRCGNCFR